MKFRPYQKEDSSTIIRLFTSVFSDSEGEAEGALIGRLASALLETTDEHDLFNFVAEVDGKIVGSVFFSRLSFEDAIQAFILAPVAVLTDYQGQGIGQALIRHGLDELRTCGVRVVLTYGDPRFYGKLGFQPVSHHVIRPPFELSLPEGWLGQSLDDAPIESLSGCCGCVAALNDPVYW
ncbi:MAG: GNAT family N-acetyltransferase [Pseudomonadota bacterium]